MFGGRESDGIVARDSQVDGRLSTATIVYQGVVHSGANSLLGCSEPTILGPSGAATRMIELLNEPLYTSMLFASVP